MMAMQGGMIGADCRGAEHEVELVWSLKSGKTRIYWNRRNISNNLLSEERTALMVKLSWKTNTGEVLTVIAHAEPTHGNPQYELLIDDVSFYNMPNVVELGSADMYEGLSNSTVDSDVRKTQQSVSNGSEFDSLKSMTEPLPHDGIGFRLSMVGLGAGLAVTDELRSEVYSPMLESLRKRLVEFLPQTEALISRSIIQTFFPDYVSQHSEDILSCRSGSRSNEEQEPQQIEADALYEAHEWMACFEDSINPPEEEALDYMQKLIDSVFVKVRNEHISSDEGARVLLGVAAVLRLDFNKPLPKDTIILERLSLDSTPDDLHDALRPYGEVEAVGNAARNPTFGFCRFMNESSLTLLQEAVGADEFRVWGCRPLIIPLTEKMGSAFGESIIPENSGEKQPLIQDSSQIPGVRKDSSSSVPHLMGAWTDDDDAVERMVVVTPDHNSRTFEEPKHVYRSPRSISDFEDLVDQLDNSSHHRKS